MKEKQSKKEVMEEQPQDEIRDGKSDAGNLQTRLERLSADFLNLQKRSAREAEQARKFANENLIKALLPVIDDMERALEAARDAGGEENPLFMGMKIIHDKAVETLGNFGVSIIIAAEQAFDPDFHSAIMQEPTDEFPPMTVIREVQRGYMLNGRTLRPTSVIVAKAPEQEQSEPTGEDDADIRI